MTGVLYYIQDVYGADISKHWLRNDVISDEGRGIIFSSFYAMMDALFFVYVYFRSMHILNRPLQYHSTLLSRVILRSAEAAVGPPVSAISPTVYMPFSHSTFQASTTLVGFSRVGAGDVCRGGISPLGHVLH